MSSWIQATMQQNTISFDWLISNAPYYCFPSNYSIDFKAETIKFIKLVFGFKTPLIGRIYYCHNSLQRQEKCANFDAILSLHFFSFSHILILIWYIFLFFVTVFPKFYAVIWIKVVSHFILQNIVLPQWYRYIHKYVSTCWTVNDVVFLRMLLGLYA